jgi:hypothetical protein
MNYQLALTIKTIRSRSLADILPISKHNLSEVVQFTMGRLMSGVSGSVDDEKSPYPSFHDYASFTLCL